MKTASSMLVLMNDHLFKHLITVIRDVPVPVPYRYLYHLLNVFLVHCNREQADLHVYLPSCFMHSHLCNRPSQKNTHKVHASLKLPSQHSSQHRQPLVVTKMMRSEVWGRSLILIDTDSADIISTSQPASY